MEQLRLDVRTKLLDEPITWSNIQLHLIPHFIEAFQITYDGHELRIDKQLNRKKIKRL